MFVLIEYTSVGSNCQVAIWVLIGGASSDQCLRIGQHSNRPIADICTVVFRPVKAYIPDRARPDDVIDLGRFSTFGKAPRALSAVPRRAILPACLCSREALFNKLV